MKTTNGTETDRTQRLVRIIDYSAGAVLTAFLAVVIISSGMANIQTDAIDYYAIVQRITPGDGNPIVSNLHFVEQRSPGYPILSLIPYYLLSSVVEPFVRTEEAIPPPRPASPPTPGASERMLLPSRPLLFRDVFFKNFYIREQDSWFEWKIIAAMLLTSYALLFIGLIFVVKTLALEDGAFLGASLAPLGVVASSVFMYNIVNTPAYATLAAFGISGLFGYFFVRGFLRGEPAAQFLAGLFVGLLVLTRLETVVIAAVVLVSLAVVRQFDFLRNYVLGASIPAAILLLYNLSQFGNPFHVGILEGDINLLAFDWSYIYANLFSPQSGLLFWSTLTSLGIVGLFLDGKRHTSILGLGSLALIAVILVRVPTMYYCVGQGMKLIGGLPIVCPDNMAEMMELIRSDANRYVTVLIPFSTLGLRTAAVSAWKLWRGFTARR